MATNTSTERRRSLNPAAIGANYDRMAFYTIIIVLVAAFIGAAFWSGYYFYPVSVLNGEEAQPISAQIPLDVMPALPDELAVIYDELNASQEAQISSYEFIDRDAGTVRIPVSDAAALMLEQDLFPVREATGEGVGAAADDERGSDSDSDGSG
jgi:hypothetical protein